MSLFLLIGKFDDDNHIASLAQAAKLELVDSVDGLHLCLLSGFHPNIRGPRAARLNRAAGVYSVPAQGVGCLHQRWEGALMPVVQHASVTLRMLGFALDPSVCYICGHKETHS